MLITCPECQLQLSDKALSCPHCGFPMQPQKQNMSRKTPRHRRLPNGFGQISEIKNKNLRNPFRVLVTVGKTEEGKPICKPLKPQSYFKTYNEAYNALVEYNKNPFDLQNLMTMQELYDHWSVEYFEAYSAPSTVRGIKDTWKYCHSIYNMPVIQVRPKHMLQCINYGEYVSKHTVHHPSPKVKGKMKSIFNQMFDYAVKYDITDKNYARLFNLDPATTKAASKTIKEHIPFDDDEMITLWEHVDDLPGIDIVLIQCYSGLRPQEIGLISLQDYHPELGILIGGIKTAAGKNRMIPIHPKIRKYVEKYAKQAKELHSEFLINWPKDGETYLSYLRYASLFYNIRNELGLNPEHRPHDGRKHFITQAKKYGVDEYAIKYIVGHQIQDITERVYTTREREWLISEIEKIK